MRTLGIRKAIGAVASLTLALAMMGGFTAPQAHATCWAEPGAGDVVNDADEAVNIEDRGDDCPGPTIAILHPGERSDSIMRDTDYFWDNKKWVNPSENVYNANQKYKINYGQNFRCFDRDEVVNGHFIQVQCD